MQADPQIAEYLDGYLLCARFPNRVASIENTIVEGFNQQRRIVPIGFNFMAVSFMTASIASHLTELEHAIAQQHQASPFSGVIWIKEKDELVFAKAYGFATLSEGIPNELNTRFGLASGTKIFTGVAICQLIEHGLLSLDTLLEDCLDIPFSHFDPTISVRHLLTHSAGIPDYFNEEELDDYESLWKERPMYSLRALKDFLPLFQDREMVFSPGERFAYNNAGYILLGLMVEHISGQRFQNYVKPIYLRPAK